MIDKIESQYYVAGTICSRPQFENRRPMAAPTKPCKYKIFTVGARIARPPLWVFVITTWDNYRSFLQKAGSCIIIIISALKLNDIKTAVH